MQVRPVDQPRLDSVAMRMPRYAVELAILVLVPGDDERTRLDRWQVHARVDPPVSGIALLDEFEFRAPRRLIEAGVEKSAIALARAFEDVRRLLDHDGVEATNGAGSGDRTSDDACPDHRNV